MPPFNLDPYSHCGPMARTVDDCLLFENCLAGPDPTDLVSLRPRLELPRRIPGIEGLRIALSADLGGWPLDPEVRRNTNELAFALRDQGAIVEEIELHVPQADVLRAMGIHFRLGLGAWIKTMCDQYPGLVTDYAREFGTRGITGHHDGTLYEKFTIEARLYGAIGDVFTRHDALICATCGTRGFAAGDSYIGHAPEVGARALSVYFEALLTPVFNILSRCPVLNVPSGFADNGVPTGVQIVGRTYEDLTSFRIGSACERVRPWFDVAQRRPNI